jgi:thioredoxin reductase (NADPH)
MPPLPERREAGYHVPYQWLDVEAAEHDAEVQQPVASLDEEEKKHMPLVIFPDGARLPEPSTADMAQRVGLSMRPAEEFYDLRSPAAGPRDSPPRTERPKV